MLRTIKRINREYSELKRFNALPAAEREIVFYAESGAYWGYFQTVIDALCRTHGKRIAYLTSSPSDPVLDTPPEGVSSFYIGDGTIRTIAFAGLEVGILVTTTPDLDTSYLKRSRHPVHYVYLPHNMTSTHMVFRKAAFRGYDTVFCTGPHQVRELGEAAELYGLSNQRLIDGGYVRLDAIVSKADVTVDGRKVEPSRVVIAPTWGEHALTSSGATNLVENLLAHDYEVIYRPHRVSEKSEQSALRKLDAAFGAHPRFCWAREVDDPRPYYGAGALITDWSGAAFSFAFGLLRPVLFIDLPKKMNNPDFAKFTNEPVEVALRERMGAVLAPEQCADAASTLTELTGAPDAWSAKLASLRDEYCFHIGGAAERTAAGIADIADDIMK